MSSQLELVSPILQECPGQPLVECDGRPLVSCIEEDQSCAYQNLADPCEATCVDTCPNGEKSVVFDDAVADMKYRKCVPENEPTIGGFRCFTNDEGVNQFEIQGIIS